MKQTHTEWLLDKAKVDRENAYKRGRVQLVNAYDDAIEALKIELKKEKEL